MLSQTDSVHTYHWGPSRWPGLSPDLVRGFPTLTVLRPLRHAETTLGQCRSTAEAGEVRPSGRVLDRGQDHGRASEDIWRQKAHSCFAPLKQAPSPPNA